MQPPSHAATCDFLNTVWKSVNVKALRKSRARSEEIADGDPETFLLAFGNRIRGDFWDFTRDHSTIDWDTVARFTDEWLDSQV